MTKSTILPGNGIGAPKMYPYNWHFRVSADPVGWNLNFPVTYFVDALYGEYLYVKHVHTYVRI